jgi:NAD(P)H-dependent flavin oxidoreductase YrpB (nitropropane dioxygenase family)
MKTRLTEMLGIKYPIVCGGMMRIAYPELCAAISNAGGMGNLTAAMYPEKDDLAVAIRKVRKLTDKPFIVNVTLLPAIALSEDHYKNFFDILAAEQVPAMEIGGTPLDRFAGGVYIKKLKDAGVKLIHKVGSVRHGQHAEEAGYDAVIAAGIEEGGHPLNDNVATTVLTPRMRESLSIPIITAGGMANGRSLAAALCLGGDGILMATRFLCTKEAPVHDNVRQELIRRQEMETALYGNTIGLQGRALLNDAIKEVLKIEERKGGLDEIIPLISGTIGPEVWDKGNMNVGSINVGQSMGLIHDVVSCQELLDRMVKEAEEIINQVKGNMDANQ